jgi:hypothetical protein
MLTDQLTKAVLELPSEDRLELTRRLLESVSWPADLDGSITQGIRRIEGLASGKIAGLSEEEFRAALK